MNQTIDNFDYNFFESHWEKLSRQENVITSYSIHYTKLYESFFAARGLTPNRQRHGRFIRWWHGRMEIWCGDLFDLGASDLADIGAVYDIAALTALPADSRSQYARLLTTRLPARSP